MSDLYDLVEEARMEDDRFRVLIETYHEFLGELLRGNFELYNIEEIFFRMAQDEFAELVHLPPLLENNQSRYSDLHAALGAIKKYSEINGGFIITSFQLSYSDGLIVYGRVPNPHPVIVRGYD